MNPYEEMDKLRTDNAEYAQVVKELQAEHTKLQVQLKDARTVTDQYSKEIERLLTVLASEGFRDARSDYHNSLDLCMVERDQARAEAANLQAAFKALQTHAFNLAKEHEWKLHDHYVCSVLPECLHIATRRIDAARSIDAQLFDGDESFRAAVVTEARALADAAMKAREVKE